jgi:oligoribonuclease (3'-5' exoribonuclease)
MKLQAKARLLRATDANPLFMPSRLVMIDCEMTGLDPKVDDVIQIAALRLLWEGDEYQVVEEPFNIFLHTDKQPQSEFARTHLTEIYKAANESPNSTDDAHGMLKTWLGDWYGKVSPCGDCVPTDILFLYMKNIISLSHFDGDTPVDGTFHYEFADMHFIKACARQKMGRKFDRDVPRLAGDHDALVDCKNQLNEMNAIIKVLLS